MAETRDRWAEWLARMRTSGDPEARRKGLEMHAAWRERILDNADLDEGATLLDVGCGEGLVAFGALERGAGEVVFSDISQDLLDFCRQAAAERGLLDRCRFVQASADRLTPVEDESIDVVTTRSVLIYVADKKSAFHEFARVLRSGGESRSSNRSTVSRRPREARGSASTSARFRRSPGRCERSTTPSSLLTPIRWSISTNAT
jgi:arsenite methyltransferase